VLNFMKVVNVRLAGGLGNQLFQVAYGLLASKKIHGDVALCSAFLKSYDTQRSFTLPDVIDLKGVRVVDSMLPFLIFKTRFGKASSVLPSFLGFVSDSNCKKIMGNQVFLSNLYLDGYFNKAINQVIFDEMVAGISVLFKGRHLFVRSNVCVIHVRGGDFINLGLAGRDDAEFYSSAISAVRRIVPEIRFEVVTDDSHFARSVLNESCSYKIISGESVADDFFRLATGQFAIISDSTFALWARSITLADSSVERVTFSRGRWEPGVQREISFLGERRL